VERGHTTVITVWSSLRRIVTFAKVVGVVCSICFVGLTPAAQEAPGASVSLLWSQDLVPALRRTKSGMGRLSGVTFLDDTRLIAYAVDQDLSQLSSRISPEVSSSFRLHAWVVDATSGKVEAHREWGTRRQDSDVEATAGGLLVKTGGIVRLYSPDLAQARELPLELDPNGLYFTSVSITGRSIAVSHYFQAAQRWISHVDVLDANTLRIRYSWNQYPPVFGFSMADETFQTISLRRVGIAAFEHPGRSKLLLDEIKERCAADPGGGMVSEQSILRRECNEVVLLDAGGSSYSLGPFNGRGSRWAGGNNCTPFGTYYRAAVASKGRFVALELPDLKIKKPLLAEWSTCVSGLAIAVYDLALKKRVITVKVDPLPMNDYHFALSPDASKLAILNDRNVSVYSLPIHTAAEGNGVR